MVWLSDSLLREGEVEMKTEKYLEEDLLIRKTIEALIKEVGPVETIRFMNIPRKKRIGSINRHREWQKFLKKDEFFDEIFRE